MFIIIAGGGRLGYYLLKEFLYKNHEVVLIESDVKRSKHIIDELGNLVVTGDACDPLIMEKAGILRAEKIIANTGSDESNLIICQIAQKKYKVPGTIARVNNPKNEEIFKKLGIDVTVNSVNTILSMIEKKVEQKGVMMTLAKENDIEVTEIKLTKESPSVGRSIQDLTFPKKCFIAAVIRGAETIQPTPDIQLKENDIIIAISGSDDYNILKNELLGSDLAFHAP